jgi:hypothetical protein
MNVIDIGEILAALNVTCERFDCPVPMINGENVPIFSDFHSDFHLVSWSCDSSVAGII